jgi:hypothetical protein
VIDVHLYRGGDDPLGIEIASRLTDSRYLGYSKVTRNNLGGALRLPLQFRFFFTPIA